LDRRRAQLEEEEIRNSKKAKESVSVEDIDKVDEEEGISTSGTLSQSLTSIFFVD